MSELLEKVAETIFRNEGGMTPQEHADAMGKAQKAWKTDAPWDSQPEEELCEWERDEYRHQAHAVLGIMGAEIVEVLEGILEAESPKDMYDIAKGALAEFKGE